MIQNERRYYRIDAFHQFRSPMDEIVLGYSAAKELADIWEADGYDVEIYLEHGEQKLTEGPFRLDTWNGRNWIVSSGWLTKDEVFAKLLQASNDERMCRVVESCMP